MGEEANIKITLVYNWLGFITDLWHENSESFCICHFTFLSIYSNLYSCFLLATCFFYLLYKLWRPQSFFSMFLHEKLFQKSICFFSVFFTMMTSMQGLWGRALKICKRNWIQVRQSSRFSVFFTMMTLMQGLWRIALNICKSKWIQVC